MAGEEAFWFSAFIEIQNKLIDIDASGSFSPKFRTIYCLTRYNNAIPFDHLYEFVTAAFLCGIQPAGSPCWCGKCKDGSCSALNEVIEFSPQNPLVIKYIEEFKLFLQEV